MGFRLLDESIGLISTLILARLLTRSDFGLVAMAMAVVALLELMGAFGFDSALIQRQDTERKHYDTAWTFNVIFGLSIATLWWWQNRLRLSTMNRALKWGCPHSPSAPS